MATQEEKKAFTLRAIAPYYKDRTQCGFDEEHNNCMYLTTNGKKCVLGSFMINPNNEEYEELNVINIFDRWTQEEVLISEAVGILTASEWSYLQQMHDAIAYQKPITNRVKLLNLFTEQELINYCQKY